MNLAHITANDLKTRTTTTLPDAADKPLELELLCVTKNIKDRVGKVIKEKEVKKIKAENTNLSPQQILGFKELRERKDLRLILTDKSKKMQIVTVETYEKMTGVYTKDAKPITLEEVKHREDLNNGHVSSLIRCLQIGAANILQGGTPDQTNRNIAAALISSNQHGAGTACIP